MVDTLIRWLVPLLNVNLIVNCTPPPNPFHASPILSTSPSIAGSWWPICHLVTQGWVEKETCGRGGGKAIGDVMKKKSHPHRSYGQIILKAPILGRSSKLSNIEPDQYLHEWLLTNTSYYEKRLKSCCYVRMRGYFYIHTHAFIYVYIYIYITIVTTTLWIYIFLR